MQSDCGYWRPVAILLFACQSGLCGQVATDISIAEITQAFVQRSSKVESLLLELNETSFYPRGGMSHLLGAQQDLLNRNSQGDNVPPIDIRTQTKYRLVWANGSMRLDTDGEMINYTDPSTSGYTGLRLFHEGQGKSFLSSDATPRPSGEVWDNNFVLELREVTSAIAFLDLANVLELKDRDLTILRRQSMGELSNVVVLGNSDYNSHGTAARSRHEVFLDVERAFLPVRILAMKPDGTVGFETRIQYQSTPHVELGVMPKSIAITLVEGGSIVYSKSIEVESYAMNMEVDPSIFDFDFPPGTTVFDRVLGVATVAGGSRDERIAKEVYDHVSTITQNEDFGEAGGIQDNPPDLRHEATANANGSALLRNIVTATIVLVIIVTAFRGLVLWNKRKSDESKL